MCAITPPWEPVGALAPMLETEDAGSRGQVAKDLTSTRITNSMPQKVSLAKYCYTFPDVYFIMMIDQLQYILDVANKTINADGVENKWGKVFNDTYPGPWIRKFFTPEIFIISS